MPEARIAASRVPRPAAVPIRIAGADVVVTGSNLPCRIWHSPRNAETTRAYRARWYLRPQAWQVASTRTRSCPRSLHAGRSDRPAVRLRRVSVALLTILTIVAVGGAAGCTSKQRPDRPQPAPGDVRAQLEQLVVATSGSMRGYSRERFPHWRDTGRNCDVRDSVLQRDGKNIKLSGCNVVSGQWVSVYDNATFTDPAKIDIDHTVPLANAWRSGADKWDDSKRGDFANDLTRPQLIAVSATTNRAKGDQDPSRWKPPNHDYWCQYAKDWVTVKHYWHLSVTSEEKIALGDMLGGCTWGNKQ